MARRSKDRFTLDEPWTARLRARWLRRTAPSQRVQPKRGTPNPAANPDLSTLTNTQLLKKMGWKNKGGGLYEGYFRFKASPPIRGRIEVKDGRPEPLFYRPPTKLQSHMCTHPREKGWWYLHEHGTPPKESVVSHIYRVTGWLDGLLNMQEPRR